MSNNNVYDYLKSELPGELDWNFAKVRRCLCRTHPDTSDFIRRGLGSSSSAATASPSAGISA
jgi:hypothetical protein